MIILRIPKSFNQGNAYIAVKPENIFEWIVMRIRGYVKIQGLSLVARSGFYAKKEKLIGEA